MPCSALRLPFVSDLDCRYQKLNNGNFPSLNLTHKEVGGSFYTVREIVRDIIQENRVLGPAKFGPEEQSLNQFLEPDPLGSIATETQYPLTTLANEYQIVTNHCENTDEPVVESDADHMRPEHQLFANGNVVNGTQIDVKLEEFDELKQKTLSGSEPVEAEKNADEDSEVEVSVSDGHYVGSQHQMFDNGQIVNSSLVDVITRESDELTVTETNLKPSETDLQVKHQMVNDEQIINGSQVNEESDELTVTEINVKLSETDLPGNAPLEAENIREELVTSRVKVTPTATDVIVETFPLRPLSRTSDSLDRELGEVRDMGNTLEKQETKTVNLAANEHSSLNGRIKSLENSGLVDEKEVMKNSTRVLDKNSDVVDEEATEDCGDPLRESSNCSAPKEGSGLEIQSYTDSNAKISPNDVKTSETFGKSWENAGAKVSVLRHFSVHMLLKPFSVYYHIIKQAVTHICTKGE